VTFGLVGAMSPSTWWNGNWILGEVDTMTTPRPARVYVDCGQPDDDYADTTQLVSAYLGRGYVEGADFQHVYQLNAQHNEVYWAERLPGALAFLFGPR
jgi:predicted alpha/beta superfamily hydrolase